MNTSPSQLAIVMRPVSSLFNSPRNSRTHSKRQIRQIAESIRSFGFTNPVLLDLEDMIIAGHGRVEAAKLLKIAEVPTIQLSHLSQDQIRAYVIADNKLALNAGWDESMLAIELQHLLTIEGDFDITITGFEIPEIDLLLLDPVQINAYDDAEPMVSGPAVAASGDLWALGKHRIFCGNSLLESSFTSLLGERRADMVLVDPPYGVKIDGHATGNGALKHREFSMGCGEMTEQEFVAFLSQALTLLALHSKEGSVHFIFMSWHHVKELLTAGDQVYDSLLNIVVWAKDRAGMGSLYRSQHELCPVFRHGKASHQNNMQLGRFGRNRANVWNYPGSQTMSRRGEETDLLALHPTVKPTSMLADAMLDCSAPGDFILDSFLGSGSTLLAAEHTQRICYGMEIDPLYVDLAIRRWERYTGKTAVLVETGESFADTLASREVNRG